LKGAVRRPLRIIIIALIIIPLVVIRRPLVSRHIAILVIALRRSGITVILPVSGITVIRPVRGIRSESGPVADFKKQPVVRIDAHAGIGCCRTGSQEADQQRKQRCRQDG
jgi:hypothetical protein